MKVFLLAGIHPIRALRRAISGDLQKNFLKLCLMIDSIIYKIMAWLYDAFIAISNTKIFDNKLRYSLKIVSLGKKRFY